LNLAQAGRTLHGEFGTWEMVTLPAGLALRIASGGWRTALSMDSVLLPEGTQPAQPTTEQIRRLLARSGTS